MGKCAKRAFQNGGAVSKADQLMAEMAAKYGVSGNAQPQPAPQQPAPQPATVQQQAPQPQQRGIGGILGIVGGRQQQIDKASGFRNGGKIQGPGTPTSDSIPAKVNETGEGIAVSTDERILSADQDAMLEAMARKSGFDSLDAMLEAGTGKPVGPTIKAGKRAAADGLSPYEEQKRIQAFGATPPTLGTGLNGMTRANPDTSFVTGSAPGVAPPPQTGRDTSGIITADSAKAAMAEPMQRAGGISGSIDMAGVNGILARENKARGEMIDSMVKASGGNGIAVLPDGPPASQGLALSDIQSAMKSAGTRAERAAYGQAMNTALNNQVQQRGQDMNYAATMAGQGITARGQDLNNERAASHDQVIMRGQDINATTDAARMGIEGKRLGLAQTAEDRAADRWNVERPGILAQAKDSDAVRSARQGLMDAVASGDQKAIERARTAAVAAGIKFDKPNNEYVTTTDSMGMNITRTNKDTGAVDVIEGKSGKVKASIPGPGAQQAAQAPVPQGFTVVGTANGKRVLQDAQGKRFVEGN